MVAYIRSTLLIKYSLYYLLVLLIPMMFIFYTFHLISKSVVEIVNEGNHLAIGQFKDIMDARFEEIEKICEYFITDSTVASYSRKSYPLSDSDYYSSVLIKEHLSEMMPPYSFAGVIYIYFPNTDNVITSTAQISASLFYDQMFGYDTITAEEWKQTLRDARKVKYKILSDCVCENRLTGERYITICRTLDRNYGAQSAVMVFLIEIKRMEELANSLSISAKSVIEICTMNGTPIVSSEGGQAATYNLKDDSVLVERSSTLDFQYILVKNNSSLTSIIKDASANIQLMFWLGLALSLLISLYLAYKTYYPIHSIWNKSTAAPAEVWKKPFRNELKDIDDKLTDTIHQSLQQLDKLENTTPVYVDHMLADLIKGGVEDYDAFLKIMNNYGICFLSDRFMVISVKLDSSDEFSKNKDEYTHRLISTAIQNVSIEVFENICKCYTVGSTENEMLLFLNLYEGANEENIRQTLKYMQNIFNDQMHIQLSFAMSSIACCLDQVHTCYLQARWALEYTYTGSPMKIVRYSDIQGLNAETVNYTVDYEVKIFNFVQTGDIKGVSELLDKIFQEESGCTLLSYSSTEQMMLNVITLCFRISRQMEVNIQQILPQNQSIIKQIAEFDHISRFKEFVLTLLKKIYQCSLANKQEECLKDEIISFILGHYSDINLSVSMLADSFNLSQSNLSTYFKKKTGINISDYIRRVRIDKAKDFMRIENLSLSQIARKTGYVSDATFIRSFKKCEGITPSSYREIINPKTGIN